MSRIVVLGSTGMLGHKMLERLRLHYEDVIGLSRVEGLCTNDTIYMKNRLIVFRPDIIVNCVGLIKQRPQDAEESIQTNALFPHFLQRVSQDMGARLIHFSTDCVFSGKQGNYTEADTPDPGDLYGRTKLLGEVVDADNALTIRTSIIGRELTGGFGLLEWFLRQRDTIQGYTNAIFSGVTTNWLADAVVHIIERPSLSGLYQVAAQPVSKFNLLQMFRIVYDRWDIEINPTETFPCDRSLLAGKFQLAAGIVPQNLFDLLTEQREQYKESGYAL